MNLTVYLSGEIHTDWRARVASAVSAQDLPVEFSGPVTDHAASDDVGIDVLGKEDRAFWKDNKGAGINAIRTRTAIERSDVVVVRFGDQYRQWNAAFDAGYAAALGKPSSPCTTRSSTTRSRRSIAPPLRWRVPPSRWARSWPT